MKRREHFTIRYQGNPEGIAILITLLRAEGLKVSGGLSVGLPYPGQQWQIRRDFVQAYGKVLEVSGRESPRLSAEIAIEQFRTRFPDAAVIEING
jgi:hypothetical protein